MCAIYVQRTIYRQRRNIMITVYRNITSYSPTTLSSHHGILISVRPACVHCGERLRGGDAVNNNNNMCIHIPTPTGRYVAASTEIEKTNRKLTDFHRKNSCARVL